MPPIRWPRLQSPALGTDSGTACDQRAILYMLYIRLIDMFKTGNISSDPDTSTHTPDFNSRTPPEVDQSLIPCNQCLTEFSRTTTEHTTLKHTKDMLSDLYEAVKREDYNYGNSEHKKEIVQEIVKLEAKIKEITQ